MQIKIKEAARKFKNCSLYRLAQAINRPEQTVYKLSKGQAGSITFDLVDDICEFLGCEIGDILQVERKKRKHGRF